MNKFYFVNAIVLASIFGLISCGEKPAPKEQISSATTTTEPVYEATLSDGIDFKKPGYPNFVANVSGMSGVEAKGRWTDTNTGPKAIFHLKQALPKKFTLEIVADVAFGPNVGAPVKVRVGGVEKTFVIGATPEPVYKLSFETDGTSDTLEIAPEKPTSPNEIDSKNNDMRKLGIYLVSIKIVSN